jgi:hypothetical protein
LAENILTWAPIGRTKEQLGIAIVFVELLKRSCAAFAATATDFLQEIFRWLLIASYAVLWLFSTHHHFTLLTLVFNKT